jgi:23S rRNA A2030 N6-methylase RlmJ
MYAASPHATWRPREIHRLIVQLNPAASGMFVINPPHTLKGVLQAALPQLLTHLGRGRGKSQALESGG